MIFAEPITDESNLYSPLFSQYRRINKGHGVVDKCLENTFERTQFEYANVVVGNFTEYIDIDTDHCGLSQ